MQLRWINRKRIAVIGILFLFAGTAIGLETYSKPHSLRSANSTNQVVSATISPSSLASNPQQTPAQKASTKESDKAENSTPAPTAQTGNTAASNSSSNEYTAQKAPEQTAAPKTDDNGAMPAAVQDKAAELVSKPVSTDDYFKAASTILGKLSFTEIKYIFDSARDDFWITTSVEDINNIRNMLFSKLSDDDLKTLIELGRKYGRSMSILDKNIDVAKAKEGQIARRSALSKK